MLLINAVWNSISLQYYKPIEFWHLKELMKNTMKAACQKHIGLEDQIVPVSVGGDQLEPTSN